MVIRGKEFFVPRRYPKDASSKLEYDNKMIKELDQERTGVVHNVCKDNPLAQPTLKIQRRTSSTSRCSVTSYMRMMVWSRWGATIHSGHKVTREHYALKYHLPLTPPQINFFLFKFKFLYKFVSPVQISKNNLFS